MLLVASHVAASRVIIHRRYIARQRLVVDDLFRRRTVAVSVLRVDCAAMCIQCEENQIRIRYTLHNVRPETEFALKTLENAFKSHSHH